MLGVLEGGGRAEGRGGAAERGLARASCWAHATGWKRSRDHSSIELRAPSWVSRGPYGAVTTIHMRWRLFNIRCGSLCVQSPCGNYRTCNDQASRTPPKRRTEDVRTHPRAATGTGPPPAAPYQRPPSSAQAQPPRPQPPQRTQAQPKICNHIHLCPQICPHTWGDAPPLPPSTTV